MLPNMNRKSIIKITSVEGNKTSIKDYKRMGLLECISHINHYKCVTKFSRFTSCTEFMSSGYG